MSFPYYTIQVEIPTIVFTLRSGGDFLPEHVFLLAEQIKENTTLDLDFICFTDFDFFDYEGIQAIPLEFNYPGWWSCLESYRVIGSTIAIDLDTTILGSVNSLVELCLKALPTQFYSLRSFLPPKRLLSGIVCWNGDWSWLLEEFDYTYHSKRSRGDQDYIRYQFREKKISPHWLQDHVDGIYSYKRNCQKGIPDDCKILVFHGKPRPWQVPTVWEPIRKKYL